MRMLKLGGLAKERQTVEFKSKEQYISELLNIELKEREVNRINRMVKAATFPVIKTLDDFVWTPNIEIPQGITKESIENFSFVAKKENLILMGSVVTGISHLATAIALKACQAGKNVRFYSAAGLANLLLEKNQKSTLSYFMK